MKPAKACKFVNKIFGKPLHTMLIISGFPRVYKNERIYQWLWVYILLPFLPEDSLNELAQKQWKPLLKLYRILERHHTCFEKLLGLLSEKEFFDLLQKFQNMKDYDKSRHALFLIADDTQSEKFGKQMEFIAKLFDHAKKRYIYGYNYFFVIAVQNDLALPLCVKMWLPKTHTEHHSKNDMLTWFCTELHKKCQYHNLSLQNVELLFDSAYFVGKVIESATNSQLTVITKASDRQKFDFEGQQLAPSEIIDKVKDRNFKLFDASKNEEYQHFKCKHPKYGEGILTVRKRKLKNGQIAHDVLYCNKLKYNSVRIIKKYKERWEIEMQFKYYKQYLDLGKKQFRKLGAIKSQLFCVAIAGLIIALFRNQHSHKISFRQAVKEIYFLLL